MKKEFIKLSGILCAITLVAALLLAGVNHITAPKIAESEEKASLEAMQKILPEADSFEELEENVFKGMKNGSVVGFCTKVSANGYGGAIEMMVAFNMEQKISGIEILSHGETAGLGAKATEPKFKDQFKGKNPTLTVVKGEINGADQISAITGATVTSRAIAEKGIGLAKAKVEQYYEQAEADNFVATMYKVVPEAATFEQMDEFVGKAKNEKGEIIGYCVLLPLVSEQVRFVAVVGVVEDEIVNIEILNHTEGVDRYDKLSDAAQEAVYMKTYEKLYQAIGMEGESNAENN